MQKETNKFGESLIFEGMTSIRAIIYGIDNKVSARQINKIYFDKAKLSKISKEVRYLRAVSGKYGFVIEEADREFIDALTVGNTHGGIIATCGERELPFLSEEKIVSSGFYAMIEGIEDPYNFGYAIRSLYATGCDGIILGERNWMSAAGVVCRSSAGASEMINIFKSSGEEAAIDIFKNLGYTVICANKDTDNVLGSCEMKKPLLLIVGGEKRGNSAAVLKKADLLVKIPYGREFRASLSAASATTMFAYEILRQNLK